jgi:hypothetical protein
MAATLGGLLELCQRFAEHSGPEVARAIRETDVILLEVRATEPAGNGRRGGSG